MPKKKPFDGREKRAMNIVRQKFEIWAWHHFDFLDNKMPPTRQEVFLMEGNHYCRGYIEHAWQGWHAAWEARTQGCQIVEVGNPSNMPFSITFGGKGKVAFVPLDEIDLAPFTHLPKG